MDYAHHYARLMDRAKTRTLTGYIERHHVIPRCLGGDNNKDNIVRLTPEEHYVSHQLLVKMYPGNIKLLWAASNMTGSTKRMPGRKNKLYGWIRRKLSDMMRGRTVSDNTKALLSANHNPNSNRNRPKHSKEAKEKMSAASKGRNKSPEHCAALAIAKLGKSSGIQSPEWIAKRVEATIKTKAKNGRPAYFNDPDYKAARRQQMVELWNKRKNGLVAMPKMLLNFHIAKNGGNQGAFDFTV